MGASNQLVLGDDGKARPSFTPHTVLKDVAAEFCISQRKIKSPKKGSRIVCVARDELCRRLHNLGYSTTDVGEYLCGRNHSTISAAIKRANGRLET